MSGLKWLNLLEWVVDQVLVQVLVCALVTILIPVVGKTLGWVLMESRLLQMLPVISLFLLPMFFAPLILLHPRHLRSAIPTQSQPLAQRRQRVHTSSGRASQR